MNLSRRSLLKLLAASSASIVVSSGLQGCEFTSSDTENRVSFDHGIASGDPLQDRVILWTRVTPTKTVAVQVAWEVAADSEFFELVNSGVTMVDSSTDYTLKIDVTGLTEGTVYFYRFMTADSVSPIGQTKTLANRPDQARFAVFSCANYPAGFFHVYQDAANRADEFDVVLHLGDYIYEYDIDGYPEAGTGEAIGRVHSPVHECVSLADYRQRYAQYHADESLKSLHANAPFICIWDDHEIADDSYIDGALNHTTETEGAFDDRKEAAIQAWYEWLPVRAPVIEADKIKTFRQFDFGDIVSLLMLDTRVVGRDRQLSYLDYVDFLGNFYENNFSADLNLPDRTLLGEEQLSWLMDRMSQSKGDGVVWQVLGQQVLMAKMQMPFSIISLDPPTSYAEYQVLLSAYSVLTDQVIFVMTEDGSLHDYESMIEGYDAMSEPEKARALTELVKQEDSDKYDEIYVSLTEDVQQLLSEKGHLLDPEMNPDVPYNLDAWDGYPYERELVLEHAKHLESNLLVLAGDTHNVFCSYLTNDSTETVGIEFSVGAVSSPGMEIYLDIPLGDEAKTESEVVSLVDDLQYFDSAQRGYLIVEFNHERATGTWYSMPRGSEKNPIFTPLNVLKTYTVNAGERILND